MERGLWRERVLTGISWLQTGAGVFAATWFVVAANRLPQMVPVLVSSAVVSLLVALTRRLPFAARGLALLFALYVPCTYSGILGGFAPNPTIGFALIVVTATLLFGRTAGLTMTVIAVVTLFGTSFLHIAGWVERVHDWAGELDSTSLAVTVRVAFIFGLLSTGIVMGISYLFARSEEAALDTATALVKLREEQIERERMAKDLERREAAYRKAQELEILGRLAGSIAHDFNNSLVIILASVEELTLLGPLPKSTEPALQALRTATEQAIATARQLRAFGPTPPHEPQQVAARQLMGKATTMLERLLPSAIVVTAEVELDVTVRVDEGELLAALTNLALNARDAMRDGGKLTFRVRPPRPDEPQASAKDQPYVVLEVEDTGAGMTDEVKEHLFEPYFTTKQATGTGLGLASVRTLVERHGGTIAVSSTLGVGSTISMFWPLVEEQRPDKARVAIDKSSALPARGGAGR